MTTTTTTTVTTMEHEGQEEDGVLGELIERVDEELSIWKTTKGLTLHHYRLMDGGIVDYYPGFLSKAEADELWSVCKYDPESASPRPMAVPWKQDMIVVGSREVLEPRFTAFLGEREGLEYTYSSKLNVSAAWPPLVASVRERIEQEIVKHPLNVVLMNWYADGRHHVSWHSDNEEDLVQGAAIASLSLGATRTFQLRHKSESALGGLQTELGAKAKEGAVLTAEELEIMKKPVGKDPRLNKVIDVNHGDLLIMRGTLQQHWRHRVPMLTSADASGPRICFTFRRVAKDLKPASDGDGRQSN